jgi:NADPH-dependent curcumin reductase CurA
LAKLAGNHVIGTCGSDTKVQFLKDLGCDRVINYKTEDLNSVLQKEYPKGIDLVYECVGGKTLETIINNIAVHGKIVLIGMISGYADQSFTKNQRKSKLQYISHINMLRSAIGTSGYPTELKLLLKSASMRGFYLGNHMEDVAPHAMKLMGLVTEGKIKVVTDCSLKGLEHIADAVDYLYAGKNTGKVLVDLRK